MAQLKDTSVTGNLAVSGDIQIKEDFIADYIVEQGTASSGYYRKYASGLMEAWGSYNFGTVDIKTAWGSLYESTTAYSIDISGYGFISKPQYANLIPDTGNGAFFIEVQQNGIKQNSLGFFFIRPSAYTVSQASVGYHVIGRWK